MIRVIPNMLDVATIRRHAARDPGPALQGWLQAPVVVSVGRFSVEKGTAHLVRAFAAVRQAVPARLLLLGDGPLRPRLEALVDQLGLSRHVHFAGFVDAPWSLVARSTVFVLPSISEGLPNALLEAMACGVPAVATDCTGAREVLDGPEHLDRRARGVEHAPHGVLVPVPSGRLLDADAPLEPAERFLAQAIVELLASPALRRTYAEAGRRKAALFEPSRVAAAWREVVVHALDPC